eukprot:s5256_g1.t1
MARMSILNKAQLSRRALSALKMTQSATSQRGNAAGVTKLTKLCCQVLLDPTEHRIVRTEAARVLQEVDAADRGTAEALSCAARTETDRFVRRSLVDAAAHFAAHRSAVEALLALSEDGDRFVRDAAVAALADLGGVVDSNAATLIEDGHKKMGSWQYLPKKHLWHSHDNFAWPSRNDPNTVTKFVAQRARW